MDLIAPDVYENLHDHTKREIRSAVSDQSAEMVSTLMSETQSRILELLNLIALMGRLAEENKEQVVKMFLEIGQREYRFVEQSGLWFGLLFGCMQVRFNYWTRMHTSAQHSFCQASIFYFYDAWWILPTAGLFVGWFTNYLAITLIFEPTDPIHFCGYTIQGVFLKRQQEASISIAELSQSNFLTVDHLMNEIVFGVFSLLVQC